MREKHCQLEEFIKNNSSEKWFNYVVPFFWKMPKIWGRSDGAKRRKKRGWPKSSIEFITCDFHNPFSSKSQMLDSPTVRSLEQSVRVLEEIV